jgi:broad specificity phosphatase PhoE
VQRLTVDGIHQAHALRMDPFICETNFWRIYSSDLGRAQHTTSLILNAEPFNDNLEDSTNVRTLDFSRTEKINTKFTKSLIDNNVILETKIRETSKGARQGFLKTMNMREAIEERKRLGLKEDDYPVSESLDDGWSRISSWLSELITIAWTESFETSIQTTDYERSVVSRGDTIQTNNDSVFNVLAVCHSGILRTFLSRLIGDNRLRAHPSTKYDESNTLNIPNTSITIIDISINSNTNSPTQITSNTLLAFQNYDEREGVDTQTDAFGLSVDIVEMTSTRHYQA